MAICGGLATTGFLGLTTVTTRASAGIDTSNEMSNEIIFVLSRGGFEVPEEVS